jgi:hypothetical protein
MVSTPTRTTRPTRTRVTVTARPLWRVRLARVLPRYLLYALAVMGLLASTRFAIAPPRAVLPRAPHLDPPDLAAEGFAALFADRYLSWDSRDPLAHQRALASFVGAGMDPDAGLQPPSEGEQSVRWTRVVQVREVAPGEHVYTVAAQTDTAGLLYLSVSIAREVGGSLALAGYPAFVGAPASRAADVGAHGRLRGVEDPALGTVLRRALHNYLAVSASELAADLTAEARISLPGLPLVLQSVQSLGWSPDGGSVFAVVQARDQRGARYTLDYELDVAQRAGRWEISAIQMDPTT